MTIRIASAPVSWGIYEFEDIEPKYPYAQVLDEIILPSFDHLIKLEADNKILGGGLPVGDRAFVFIIEASSNEELDQLLRSVPMWGSLQWEVTMIWRSL